MVPEMSRKSPSKVWNVPTASIAQMCGCWPLSSRRVGNQETPAAALILSSADMASA